MGEYSHAITKNGVVFTELELILIFKSKLQKVGVSRLNSSVLDPALSLNNTAYCQLSSYDQILQMRLLISVF